jgi:16S rRNA G1207 methylase RsmC
MMATLHDIAPRLARARDLLAEQRESRRRYNALLLKAERNLAHRELQLARAYATRRAVRNRQYMEARQRKLEESVREVADLKARASRLEGWAA